MIQAPYSCREVEPCFAQAGEAARLYLAGVFRRGVFFCLLLLMLSGGAALAEDDTTFEDTILPLVQKYCVDCHDAEQTEGDLNLERFESKASVLDALAIWNRAGKRIENKEMPPSKKKTQPTDEERLILLGWIDSLKLDEADCDNLASEETASWFPGYVMSRRLNRIEYERTLTDLLGVPLEVARMFPEDGAGGEGFNNDGNALFLSAIQVEKYLAVADMAIEEALPDAGFAAMAPGGQFVAGSTVNTSSPDDARRAALRRSLIPVRPGHAFTDREAAARGLNAFLSRAWRRPVSTEEVDRLMGLYGEALSQGATFEEALKLSYKAALVSPNFVFLAEPQPEEQGDYELGDYPLASRLSYFLWSTMPDEELFELAAAGRLKDPEVLRGQIGRMLRDPKAKALGSVFAAQWLGITQLGETIRPDEDRFPEFDGDLAWAMREEAALFFQYLVAEDRSLVELINADYTFANEDLAAIYGISGVEGDELRQVKLADAGRGGVLGMAAVLTSTSHALRTSPVLRGKWVMEQLLGERVPPPPPNVPTLPEDDVQPDGLSFRERLEQHRKDPACASCHSTMDPLGFGLENFDPIGRWREEQAGQPIDATGTLPSGQEFSGPVELKAILLERKRDFANNLTRKMLGYGLGRSITRFDQCVIDDCLEALEQNDYRPSVLVTEIVMSYPFRHRFSAGAN